MKCRFGIHRASWIKDHQRPLVLFVARNCKSWTQLHTWQWMSKTIYPQSAANSMFVMRCAVLFSTNIIQHIDLEYPFLTRHCSTKVFDKTDWYYLDAVQSDTTWYTCRLQPWMQLPSSFQALHQKSFKFRVLLPKARGLCPNMEKNLWTADGCGGRMWALKWDLPVEFARHQGNPGYSGSARGAWNGIGQSELDLYNTAALGTAIYCFHLLFWSCFCVVQPLELSELHAELQQAVPRCESHCSDLSIYGCCEVGQIGNGRTIGHCGHWL